MTCHVTGPGLFKKWCGFLLVMTFVPPTTTTINRNHLFFHTALGHGPLVLRERCRAQMRRRHVEDAWEGGLSWSRKHFEVGERLMRWQRNFLSCSGFSFDEFAWTSRVFRLGFGIFQVGAVWVEFLSRRITKIVCSQARFRRFATSLGVEFGGWSSSIGWCTRICGLEFDLLGFENFFSGYGRNLRFLFLSLFLVLEREIDSEALNLWGVGNFLQSDFRVMVYSLDAVLVFRKVPEISGFWFKFSNCSILGTSTDFAEFAFVGFKISWNLKKWATWVRPSVWISCGFLHHSDYQCKIALKIDLVAWEF